MFLICKLDSQHDATVLTSPKTQSQKPPPNQAAKRGEVPSLRSEGRWMIGCGIKPIIAR